jgi:hypothetical protein
MNPKNIAIFQTHPIDTQKITHYTSCQAMKLVAQKVKACHVDRVAGFRVPTISFREDRKQNLASVAPRGGYICV